MSRYIDADLMKYILKKTSLDRGRLNLFCRLLDETPTADVVPRADVAREIFEELETVLYKIAKPSIRADGILETKIMDGFHIRIEDYNAIRKKYESEGAE